MAKTPITVKFNYVKGPNYQTYHVDGVIGGLTPKGKVFIDFFIERGAVPRVMEYDVDNEGRIDGAKGRVVEARDGLIRQIDSGIIMDMETAKSLLSWLDNKVNGPKAK